MKKDVRAISLPDETVPFELVEPFDPANHSASFQGGLSTFASSYFVGPTKLKF